MPGEWGAAPARSLPELHGPPQHTLVHHTAGLHQEIALPANESKAELFRYARDVQAFHMRPPPRGRGWRDSGHNFLIGLNGMICVGRRWSLAAARVGLAVESAHCPGWNDKPGIELEHIGERPMPPAQWRALVQLIAWQRSRDGGRPTALSGHRDHYATHCPSDVIYRRLPELRLAVARELNRYGRDPATRLERARFRARYLARIPRDD
jgi:hypothetical protein